jgi:hypothetical protein
MHGSGRSHRAAHVADCVSADLEAVADALLGSVGIEVLLYPLIALVLNTCLDSNSDSKAELHYSLHPGYGLHLDYSLHPEIHNAHATIDRLHRNRALQGHFTCLNLDACIHITLSLHLLHLHVPFAR